MEFEKSITRVEQIVDMLESGQIPIDKGMNLFKEGMQLVKKCESFLNESELTVHELVNGNIEA